MRMSLSSDSELPPAPSTANTSVAMAASLSCATTTTTTTTKSTTLTDVPRPKPQRQASTSAAPAESSSASRPKPQRQASVDWESSGNGFSGLGGGAVIAAAAQTASTTMAPSLGSGGGGSGGLNSLPSPSPSNASSHASQQQTPLQPGLSSSAGGTPQSVNDRKESYKAQRKNYAKEKKRVGRELLSTFKDESIIVLADWLKVRGSLKSWTKLWCVLKPGLLLIYRSQKTKSSHWIGTIILSTCELIERPSKKNGFCFKLFHPMDQSIWASRGPEGEAIGAVVQPLPTSHLIFRAPNNAAGKCWMDALELALRCSSLLLRTMSSGVPKTDLLHSMISESESAIGESNVGAAEASDHDNPLNDSDMENHFKSELDGDCGNHSSGCEHNGEGRRHDSFDEDDEDCDSDYSEDNPFETGENETPRNEKEVAPEPEIRMTVYEPDPSAEVFGTAGDQTEEISDENKSIVWFLVKQVRPGMDLSRVVLPTFILEPRSFLDKISDYYYHADLLSEAVRDESPLGRMRKVVQWYLSGFYKKPKGLKKPYNPILGETFRCYWQHANGSKTYYISEQVSHHPPISAFYVANRREGFIVSSSILAKSKFYGNSTSAILEGTAKVSLLPRGEDYMLTSPYAHCKGILMGTMTMELGGKVSIECGKTGYNTEMEFKLRPFLGGGEFTNAVSGKLRLGKEVLFTIDGHWDDTVMIKDKKTGAEEVLWKVTHERRQARLDRFTVPMDDQSEFESVRLWRHVSKAIDADDQIGATDEKSKLEEEQRAGARERKVTGEEWVPKYFELDHMTDQYEYMHADLRPWDTLNDIHQYEQDHIVCTKTKHKTPMIRAQSIISISKDVDAKGSRSSIKTRRRKKVSAINVGVAMAKKSGRDPQDSTASTIPEEPDSAGGRGGGGGGVMRGRVMNSSSGSAGSFNGDKRNGTEDQNDKNSYGSIYDALRPLEEQQRLTNERLAKLQHSMEVMTYQHREQRDASNSMMTREIVLVVVLVIVIQAVINWFVSQRVGAGQDLPLMPPPPPPAVEP